VSDLSERLVEALNYHYGAGPGARAAHANGVVCEAVFTATPAAAALTRAAHLGGEPVPALVRFSNGSGRPGAPDWGRDRRGMATRFQLPGGGATDIVAITLPVFFARTPEDFIEFLGARESAFADAHAESRRAIDLSHGALPPASYARAAYHAVHAFRLIASDGAERFARYHWEPDLGVATLDVADAKSRPATYLRDELRARLEDGPAGFRLLLELADPGDPVDDPTAVWPPGRTIVDAGRLEIRAEASDRAPDGGALVFDPTRVTDGIACSDDPLLLARPGAYRLSAARRS
jgi:catalase